MLSGNTYSPSTSVADSTTTSDNNLRSAIAAANADTGTLPDTINLSSGTYTLSLGQLEITNTDHTLIIEGQASSGPDATIIDQTALDRVFEISGARVIFENLEITGGTAETNDAGATTGQAEGGGILDEGNVTLDNVAVSDNQALGQGTTGQNAVGGGVFSTGTLIIGDGSVIENDSAIGANGVSTTPKSAAFYGNGEVGGVYSSTDADLQISDSTIENNTAQGGTSSVESAEPGLALGGGIYIFNATGASTSQLTGDTISGNQAIAGAGAAGTSGGGHGGEGGLAFGGGVEIDYETAAESGTASAIGGPVTISNSTISGNTAQGGAGGAAGSGRGVVGNGDVGVGGGIDNEAPGSEFLDDTFYGNSALGGNGEAAGDAFGGGFDDESTGVLIVGATVTANTAQAGTAPAGGTTGSGYGGGIDNDGNADPELQLQNSLVAGNTAPTGPDFYATVVNTDHNLIGDATGSSGFSVANGDQLGTSGSPINAKLGPLKNNGGNTDTVALLAGSPALGTGDPAVATADGLTIDQRGLPRIVAEKIDIGAIESQAAPVLTSSGSTANYTAGAPAVAINAGVTVSSNDADLTGATLTIGTGFQSGSDTLHFANQNGISGSYAGGTLTLSGSATPAQYQAALASVTFSSTGTSTATRTISIVVDDANDAGSVASNTVTAQIIVSAPVTIVGAYVAGSAWTDTAGSEDFDAYLSSHGLGDAAAPALGYALQTGSAQLTTLPWANINTISVQFSGAVNDIGLGSLKLVGGTGGGSLVAPAVTGFTSDGNYTYSWTLAGPLGNNKYVFAIATTGSSFGTPGSTQVTDANGAGISGTFANSSSSFPSGNGLAGSTFDFAFNVLPGDGNRNGLVNSSDTAGARALNNVNEATTGYSPYFDYLGAGMINSADAAISAAKVNSKQSSITGPTAPSGSPAVGTASFTALALGVQEAGGAQTGVSQTSSVSNVVSATTKFGQHEFG